MKINENNHDYGITKTDLDRNVIESLEKHNSFGNMDFTPLAPYSTTIASSPIQCNWSTIGHDVITGTIGGIGASLAICGFAPSGLTPACVGIGALGGAATSFTSSTYSNCGFGP